VGDWEGLGVIQVEGSTDIVTLFFVGCVTARQLALTCRPAPEDTFHDDACAAGNRPT